MRVRTKCSTHSILESPRKKKKANNWDYLIAWERKKGIWGTGVEADIFCYIPSKIFPVGHEVCNPIDFEIVCSCAATSLSGYKVHLRLCQRWLKKRFLFY